MFLCLRHRYFWLICSLCNLQLETVWANMPSIFTKMTNPQRSIMQLILREVRIKGLDSLRSTLIFLRGGVTFTSLTISLLEGSKKETKFVEWVSDIEMLSTKPRTNLFKGHFWTLNMWSSLELADLFVCSLTTDNSSSKFLILSSNKMFSVFTLLINSLMIGQECIDPLWWINWLISKVY